MAMPSSCSFAYRNTRRIAKVLDKASVAMVSFPILSHASPRETSLLIDTASATLPWLTMKNVNTSAANGISAKSKTSELTTPPRDT